MKVSQGRLGISHILPGLALGDSLSPQKSLPNELSAHPPGIWQVNTNQTITQNSPSRIPAVEAPPVPSPAAPQDQHPVP